MRLTKKDVITISKEFKQLYDTELGIIKQQNFFINYGSLKFNGFMRRDTIDNGNQEKITITFVADERIINNLCISHHISGRLPSVAKFEITKLDIEDSTNFNVADYYKVEEIAKLKGKGIKLRSYNISFVTDINEVNIVDELLAL